MNALPVLPFANQQDSADFTAAEDCVNCRQQTGFAASCDSRIRRPAYRKITTGFYHKQTMGLSMGIKLPSFGQTAGVKEQPDDSLLRIAFHLTPGTSSRIEAFEPIAVYLVVPLRVFHRL